MDLVSSRLITCVIYSTDVVKRVVSGHLDLNKLGFAIFKSCIHCDTKYVVHVVPTDVLDTILTELPTKYLLNLQTLQLTLSDIFISDVHIKNCGEVFDNFSPIQE